MKRRMIKIGMIAALACLFISPVFAEIEDITIGVDGLSCPFCKLLF